MESLEAHLCIKNNKKREENIGKIKRRYLPNSFNLVTERCFNKKEPITLKGRLFNMSV